MSHHDYRDNYLLLGLFGLWLFAEADAQEQQERARLERGKEEEERQEQEEEKEKLEEKRIKYEEYGGKCEDCVNLT